jgi:hypothetical protein
MAAFAGFGRKARAPKPGWRAPFGGIRPCSGQLASRSGTRGENVGRCRRARASRLPPRHEVSLHLASPDASADGRPFTRVFAGAGGPHASLRRHPPGGRGGLDTGRPAHVKCLHQATVSCGPRGIDQESALPIEAIASRRLSRPIGAQPHYLTERVSGRVSDTLGIGHPLRRRSDHRRPQCAPRTGCEKSKTPRRC